tara:strand:+ start:835 stop:1602 length:768 start_codon:yes stop_codon:yes gene_type:complete
MDKFLDTLKLVEDFAAENTVAIYCPVAGVELNFKPLTVQHTKEMLRSQIDTSGDVVATGVGLANTYNNIVIENCIEGKDVANSLSIIDKECILFGLRYATDTKYKVEDKEVNLNVINQNIKALKPSKKIISGSQTLKFKTGNIVINTTLPTVGKDTVYNRAVLRKAKDKKINDVVIEIYITEACKYIDKITVGDTEVDFNDASNVDNLVNTLQKLPSSVLNAISSYITNVKTYRDSLFTVENQLVDLSTDFFSNI